MEKITGKNNEIIKGVKKLLSSSGQRRNQCLFVLEGARLVFDVLNSFFEIDCFLITEAAYAKYSDLADRVIVRSERSFFISDDIAQKLSDTVNSQGVFAVCKISEHKLDIKDKSRLIALDNIQDPGNLGTIIRTADALGIDGVIIGGGCDVYNPKVIRAAMGSTLRLPFEVCNNLYDYLANLKADCDNVRIYSTSPSSSAKSINKCSFDNICISVIGNEANGVSKEIEELADCLVTIPMHGGAESLNASVAASIVMWEMLR